jgi:CelD/BcsL family acetyltransferase involved in cellulose biosynthesis
VTVIRPWHRSEQQLKFQFSDFTLGTRRLRVFACDMGPDTKLADFRIPPDRILDTDLMGYVMRGVPVASPRPLFETREGYLIYTPYQYQRYFVNLEQPFDQYVKEFRAKMRSTMRRKISKFSEYSGGTVDFRVYRTPDEIGKFHAAARRVSAVTYQEILLKSGLPKCPAFRDQLRKSAAIGGVRGYALFHNGAPVSYLLLRAVEDVLVYEYLGFDPDFGKWSVGAVLHWLALQSIFEEQRFRMLDFTEGEGEQKRLFASGSVASANIYCLRSTLPLYLWLHLHAATERLSRFTGAILARFGLRTKIRKMLRQRR